jgi:hypothetical protein
VLWFVYPPSRSAISLSLVSMAASIFAAQH